MPRFGLRNGHVPSVACQHGGKITTLTTPKILIIFDPFRDHYLESHTSLFPYDHNHLQITD